VTNKKEQYAQKKAELISNGKIYISNDIKLPYPLCRSTAGPISTSSSLVLSFNDSNIKLEVSKNKNELYSLQKINDTYQILYCGKTFLNNIKIIPTPFHAPKQIFINLENRCIYNCAFCNLSKHKFLQKYNVDKFVELIVKASKNNDIKSMALTSGIYPYNKKIIDLMCKISYTIKQQIPNIQIGVEPCIFNLNEIKSLKTAGVDEIKINLQIPDRMIFDKLCPDFNYDNILKYLISAVDLFGKGKVTTNLIYGFGETDDTLLKVLDNLASNSIVPTLRNLRVNVENRKKIEHALSYELVKTSPKRIIYIAKKQKEILKKYNLSTRTFKTMCHPCGCCDLVPFTDI